MPGARHMARRAGPATHRSGRADRRHHAGGSNRALTASREDSNVAGVSTDNGAALPLRDRDHVLEHAAQLILASWRSFDHARPNQPAPDARHVELLSRPLPQEGSDPCGALDAAADVLDVSL